MKLDLTFRNNTRDKTIKPSFFERIIKVAVKNAKLKSKNLSLSINLVGESDIHGLNKKYRGKNKPTNVLSFPIQQDRPERAEGDEGPSLMKSLAGLGTNKSPTDIGDLFVCLSIAKKEAKEENMSVERKLAWLTVHGFLHLCGYDHERSARDAKKMVSLESKILSELGEINQNSNIKNQNDNTKF